MLNILENVSLKEFNTFHIECKSKYFVQINDIEFLKELLSNKIVSQYPVLPIGGGSNLLFTKPFEGIVIHLQNKGIDIIEKNDTHVLVRASAGENWHEFVSYCVNNNWGGIENLSLIPGNVGSCPIQNIGAYGTEIKDSFHSLDAIEIATSKTQTFTKNECNFSYRNSIFKNELKGKYIIVSVTFKLSLNPELSLEYGSISKQLEDMKIKKPSVKDVSEAVCAIRKSKLPDPAIIGNAGSFFKNPSVSTTDAEKLKTQYPTIPLYRQHENNRVKVAAGWLIEQCGWKGYRTGNVGVHSNQALVLVNYANAQGHEIVDLAKKIQESVFCKFAICLEMEVNML